MEMEQSHQDRQQTNNYSANNQQYATTNQLTTYKVDTCMGYGIWIWVLWPCGRKGMKVIALTLNRGTHNP